LQVKVGDTRNLLNFLAGVSAVYWFGVEGDYRVMVMQVLGKSLEGVFDQCERKLSVKSTCMLAIQILTRVQVLHDASFIHRDIKPDNFLMGGSQEERLVYIIDFGLAKRYTDRKTGEHIPFKEGKAITGTARYSSIATHLGIE